MVALKPLQSDPQPGGTSALCDRTALLLSPPEQVQRETKPFPCTWSSVNLSLYLIMGFYHVSMKLCSRSVALLGFLNDFNVQDKEIKPKIKF